MKEGWIGGRFRVWGFMGISGWGFIERWVLFYFNPW